MKDMLTEQLKRHEGLSLKIYKCKSDKSTIGYGRNLDDKGITAREAENMLVEDIEYFTLKLSLLPLWDSLNETRRAVLINMAYNLGYNGLMNFKKTLALIEDGLDHEASIEMLDSNWAVQVGSRATELSEQMRTGEWRKEDKK